tara:strand:- start:822 stop:1259 length:438 start_codon:yes stop_codon:yes gene_type:complete
MNLTQRPPRSARVRLGGYVILPRMLDKCRAELDGNNGEYHYNCPLDQRFLSYAGVDPDELKAEVAKGHGDGVILNWIGSHSSNPHDDHEIAQWSAFREASSPADNESREFASELVAGAGGSEREDVSTWFDILDLDDHSAYGGKA